MTDLTDKIMQRRTFAIVSHPDAGKTTLTEKLLLFGGAISLAGTVKARKAVRHATSDWMELEKQRGISITTSVMQFPYKDKIFNLLDTPGHEDFSEDTYRTLTAVDSALMVIDAAKGVEARTIKLMEVCRLRTTPIITFINKLDRDSLEPIELLDEVEKVLNMKCAPITWPIGSGKQFKGIYNLLEDRIYIYETGHGDKVYNFRTIDSLNSNELLEELGEYASELIDEIELVKGASHEYDQEAYLRAEVTPVFFGTALNNFGVVDILNSFSHYSPPPQAHAAKEREVVATEEKFSGFVFKIQANMDPQHRDRIAFMRICSGKYSKGMKMRHLRIERDVQISNALTFLAGQREHLEEAYAGDIIGLHNHGTIQIGDTFSQGENLQFIGIPNFAPEMFRHVQLRDPLKSKALLKGLTELSEEGATQVFRPISSNELILGAVGILQFEVVAYRLKNEYSVECSYDVIAISTARWVTCDDAKVLEKFKLKCASNLALDGAGYLTYLAPSMVNLNLTMERYPEIDFHATREY